MTKEFLAAGRWLALAGAALVLSASTRPLWGTIASPLPVRLTQPDGTQIVLRIRGDEHFNWFEDLDGFTVVLSQGTYSYATLDAQNRLVATPFRVGKIDPRTTGLAPHLLPPRAVMKQQRAQTLALPPNTPGPKLVPAKGTVKNLVVLCLFSDHTVAAQGRPQADYDTLMNKVGGDPVLAPTGSVRDYYTENSYGTMTLNSTVVAWVTLPHPQAYYANGTSGRGGAYPTNPQGMVEDALNLVDPLVDFGQFDTDNDGYVDAIDIIHSGYGAETGGGGGNWIWSHRWSLWALPGGQWTSSDNNAKGVKVKVFDYHTEPALWGVSGNNIVRIGVICHETGHFFGLPDLYDTDGTSEGVGSYCLMANSWGFDGSQLYPPHFSAWSKIFLGFVTPTIITPGTYSAPQVETSPTVFRINNNYPSKEYLLIENRQPVGFERDMPQGGLAIWHVDDTKTDNQDEGYPGQAGWPTNNNHYWVALLQADGQYDLEHGDNRGDGGDVYHASGVSFISPSTIPNTDRYQNGIVQPTANTITNIGPAGAFMAFNYNPGTGGGGTVVPAISVNDVSVNEPVSGTTNAVFTVSLSAVTTTSVGVDFQTSNGTAIAGIDYVATNGTLIFAAGQRTQTVSVVVNSDGLPEGNETFFLGLSNPINATLLKRSQGTCVIFSGQPPVLSSFSPLSGPVGSLVTITGTNFSPITAGNIVYFGAVQAPVLTAVNSTNLTVLVPAGATYAPISVSVGGFTAYSALPFNVTFPHVTVLTSTSFAGHADLAAGSGTHNVVVGDFNNDGRSDVAAANFNSGTVSVFRNIGSVGALSPASFATKVDLVTGSGPYMMATGDLDGDGRLDLAVVNYNSGTVSLFRNTSSSNGVSFAAKVDLTTGSNPRAVRIVDVDQDGLPDIVVANEGNSSISVFRNTGNGTVNASTFASKVDFIVGTSPSSIAVGDIDGDGKPDLIVANAFNGPGGNTLSILRNTSTPGVINSGTFATRYNVQTRAAPLDVVVGDFDGDGKLDIAVANSGNSSVSVFHNNSAPGSFVFDSTNVFASGSTTRTLAVGDVDGDGKPDLVVANESTARVVVLQNTSSLAPGTRAGSAGLAPAATISFASAVNYTTAAGAFGVAVADLDRDHKPDLIVACTNGSVSLLRNLLKANPPGIAWTTPADISYGTALSSLQLNATAGIPGNFIYNPGSGTVLEPGSHTLSATFIPFDTSIYNVTTNSVSLNVTLAALTITVGNRTRAYGAPNPVFTGTLTGVQNNDNITATYATTATASSNAGGYYIVPTLLDPGNRLTNYSVVTNLGTLTITNAPLVVTVSNQTRIYGGTNPVFTGTLTGVTNNDNITAVFMVTATPTDVVGDYPITPQLSDPNNRLPNYNVTTNYGTLMITPAPLVVTAAAASRAYAAVNPTFTGAITGLLNNDNITATYASAADGTTPVGAYGPGDPNAIKPTLHDPNGRLVNYTPTLNDGTLTITGADPPVLTLSVTTVNYTENDPPTLLDTGATVTDGGSPDFDGGQLKISFSANGAAEDRLVITNQGTATGEIGLSGNTVTLGGTNIGTFAGGTDGSTPLVVSFNTNATPLAAQALVRAITYTNISDNPSALPRTVRFDLTDGDGGTNSPVTLTINVTPVNDPPMITLLTPANGAALKAPGPITIEAQASDVDGTIAHVEFFVGAVKLGVGYAPPYRITWDNVALGSYAIVAVATDDQNAVTLSDAINVTANPAINTGQVNMGGQFELTLTGVAGVVYDVEASSDLIAWVKIGQVTAGVGATPFLDPALATSLGQRFYRFREHLVP